MTDVGLMTRIIALLQLDPKVGDLYGNATMIKAACELAAANGADLALSSELALTGYPPRDLLLSHAFLKDSAELLETLRSEIPLLLGAPSLDEGANKPHNSAYLIGEHEPELIVRKQLLPTYEVFDEVRYFAAGEATAVHQRLGITICEDAWQHCGAVPSDYPVDPIADLLDKQVDAVLNLSSSP